ncbi:unnamed protein product [Cyprideis torosa]|uniref:Uncharacterized protein n=1 Tax=Cyprideis torosa TaxID=163714 RepID=A0A7R8W7X7_9CRUS|nr:unnamed protein product [Cyprideis torosa]CAG0888033.1 unnamed protein product [Cyprideis torosa]
MASNLDHDYGQERFVGGRDEHDYGQERIAGGRDERGSHQRTTTGKKDEEATGSTLCTSAPPRLKPRSIWTVAERPPLEVIGILKERGPGGRVEAALQRETVDERRAEGDMRRPFEEDDDEDDEDEL